MAVLDTSTMRCEGPNRNAAALVFTRKEGGDSGQSWHFGIHVRLCFPLRTNAYCSYRGATSWKNRCALRFSMGRYPSSDSVLPSVRAQTRFARRVEAPRCWPLLDLRRPPAAQIPPDGVPPVQLPRDGTPPRTLSASLARHGTTQPSRTIAGAPRRHQDRARNSTTNAPQRVALAP
jgi:hypothetical protein